MDWLWASLSLIVFLSLLHQLLLKKEKRNLPPGPAALPVIGHLHLVGKIPHRDIHGLAQKHGPIMFLRFGSVSAVVVSSAAGAELVLKTHDLAFAGRPHHQASRHFGYDRRTILFTPYGAYWRSMRRLCAVNLLGDAKIDEFRPVRMAEVGGMVDLLRRDAEKREVVDLSAAISRVIGDMNCLMIFGEKYGDRDLDERLRFKAVMDELLHAAGQPNLGDFFPFTAALDLQGYDRRMKEMSTIFDRFLDRVIDDHLQKKEENKKSRSFVDTMLAVMEAGDAGFGFDRRHVKEERILQHQWVAWAISELFRHPEITKKLRNELEQVVGLDQIVNESHIDRLDYLDSVVKETLRLHPLGPLLYHESRKDRMLNGFHVPKGTWTIVNVWTIGRDPEMWHELEKFVPERFYEKNVDLLGQHFQFLPFGSGRRGCPGLQLGLTLVKLVLAQLVHCFDWELPNGTMPNDLDMSEKYGIVTTKNKPLMVIPTYRLHK